MNTVVIPLWILFCMPVRTVQHHNPVFADLASHSVTVENHRDVITAAHETTHYLIGQLYNDSVRNKNPKRCHYVLKGKYFALTPITEVTLLDVSRKIPVEMRTSKYDLYVVRQQDTQNNNPLCLTEELTCYINGAEARKAGGIKERIETLENAYELLIFTLYLRSIMSTQEDFEEYLAHECKRLKDLYDPDMKNHKIYIQHIKILDSQIAELLSE